MSDEAPAAPVTSEFKIHAELGEAKIALTIPSASFILQILQHIQLNTSDSKLQAGVAQKELEDALRPYATKPEPPIRLNRETRRKRERERIQPYATRSKPIES